MIERHYQYDPSGQLVQWQDRHRGLTRYRYDAGGRITRSQIGLAKDWGPIGVRADASGNTTGQPMAANEQFYWDAASNPLPDEAAASQGNIVPGNRLLVWQDARYTYDEHGNLIERLQGQRGSAAQTRTHFTWDAAHQLARAEVAHGPDETASTQSFTYTYDALGRRIAKTDAFGTSHFAWDDDRLVLEQRGGNETTFVYHPELFVPLAQIHNGALHHLHTDHLGTPLEASNDAGEITWQVIYRTWGNVVTEEVTEIQQRLRFQGQYFDAETGLHYNRFRYYECSIGRFASQDPIGLFGGENQYEYAPNPIEWIDPLGLEKCRLCAADLMAMGKPPPKQNNPHRHHIVREKAPKNWSAMNRKLVTRAQAILKRRGIGLNRDRRNFTWAENGAGAHTVATSRYILCVLQKANAKGQSAVEAALKRLGQDARRGIFSR